MNVTKLNRSGLNMSRLNASLLNASGMGCMGCKGKETMEDRIMQSMVLWYDLAKQGATNESMAADPRLIDHSGNGHHATCYNFAWSGMSSIGGYVVNYTSFSSLLNGQRGTGSVSGYRINITSAKQTYNLIESNAVPAHKVRVTGLTGTGITLRYGGDSVEFTYITEDGEYELPDHQDDIYIGYSLAETVKSCDITIEQLPLYPNALVSDGVDDYAVVEGLPILTKEKGFTVISKITYLEGSASYIFASKSVSVGSGAFIIHDGGVVYCFGAQTAIGNTYLQAITRCTSQSYNNAVSLNIGDALDTDTLYLATIRPNDSRFSKVAIYSFLLFDRDLTTEEIEWVKNNLITE